MPPAVAAVGSRSLLAVITPLTSVLLRSFDASNSGTQLLAMELGSVLACHSFESSEVAMCWLTNPNAIAAVAAGVVRQPPGTASATTSSSSWLAIVAQGARACFEINTSGVCGAVQLMQTTASTLCVAASFSVAADAYKWLAKYARLAMQRSLLTTAPASAPRAEKAALPAPVARSQLELELAPVPRARPPVGWPSPPSANVSPVHKRDQIGHFTTPSKVFKSSTRSRGGLGWAVDGCSSMMPSATGAASGAGSQCRYLLDGSEHQRVSIGTATTPLSVRGAGPSRVAPSLSPCPCGADVCLVGASAHGARDSRRSGGGSSFQSSNVGVKRSRGCGQENGRSDDKNPTWVGPGDPSQEPFMLQSIHRMVAESVATWDQDDLEEGLRRDAALGDQRRVGSASADKAGSSSIVAASGRVNDSPSGAARGGVDRRLGTSPSLSCANVVGGRSLRASQPQAPGPLTRMAADGSWTGVFHSLFARKLSTSVSGGPGVGKTSFLQAFAIVVRSRLPGTGAVVVVAPTGSAAVAVLDTTTLVRRLAEVTS